VHLLALAVRHCFAHLLGRMKPRIILIGVLFAAAAQPLAAYSVLSHEEVIDMMWESDINPALLKRFPQAESPKGW
jgi:hypothetical protein